jgi:AcrR family transcriptional regulator
MAATEEGLRERKKRETRERIAAAALELFTERGFDHVTVAEIADAAGVSEKTVFNYFPAKEDLLLGSGAERAAAFADALRNRGPGVSVLDSFRAWTLELCDEVAEGPLDRFTTLPRLVRDSPTLQRRLFRAWEEEAAFLSPIVAAEAGADDDDLVPWVVARTLAWTRRLVLRSAFGRLGAGEDRRAVAEDLRVQANRAFDVLAAGLGDYGVNGSAAAPGSR